MSTQAFMNDGSTGIPALMMATTNGEAAAEVLAFLALSSNLSSYWTTKPSRKMEIK